MEIIKFPETSSKRKTDVEMLLAYNLEREEMLTVPEDETD